MFILKYNKMHRYTSTRTPNVQCFRRFLRRTSVIRSGLVIFIIKNTSVIFWLLMWPFVTHIRSASAGEQAISAVSVFEYRQHQSNFIFMFLMISKGTPRNQKYSFQATPVGLLSLK